MLNQPPAVEMRAITKRFGLLVANQEVDLTVGAGDVLALLGENGAGKSTLMKVLYGLYQPDAGQIFVGGKRVTLRTPAEAIAHGIGMVTQHFALVPTLTVAENIVLGMGSGVRFDRVAAERAVSQTAERYQLTIKPDMLVRNLSVGEQQRVEILKALHRGARVLILDEPTAVLTPQESVGLFAELRPLVEQGLSIIFISHKLDEVLALAHWVMVLRDGKVVGRLRTADANANTLAELMVGRASFGVRNTLAQSNNTPTLTDSVLALRNVNALNERGLPALHEISLDVRAGEILGVAGVSGNGQTELAEVITGMRAVTHGTLHLGGTSIANATAAQATAAGIGRIPEDRKTGVVGELSVAENLALENLADFTYGIMLDKHKMRQFAEQMIVEYAIKATPDSKVGNLSGGNMQKLILARALSRNPKLIVAAQPSRGLDVGASAYVHMRLLEQRKRGAAVLLISEDLDEVLALSDRIVVMFAGRVVGGVLAADATPETLGLLMAGKTT